MDIEGIYLAFGRLGALSLLQGIFPTQGSTPGLPHCRQILYYLSHQESHVEGYTYHLTFLSQFITYVK